MERFRGADIIETMTRRSFVRTGAALTAASQLAKGSPNGKITFGMIGAGARAHELMQQLQKYPEKAEIVAVVDAYTGRVARALERTGGRAKVTRTITTCSPTNRSMPSASPRPTTGIAA